MAQGTISKKPTNARGRKANRIKPASVRKKGAPVKPKKHARDLKVTKVLHKNIEALTAAKALRYDSGFRLSDLKSTASAQLKIENQSRAKKSKTKSEVEARNLENAQKRLEKS